MNIALLVSWHTELNSEGHYFLPYTHYSYLEHIVTMYEKVYIITPVWKMNDSCRGFSKLEFTNVEIIPLPPYTSILSAQKEIGSFVKSIKYVEPKVDVIYCRVPDPFSWLPALKTNKEVIMHFVGDTIDTTKHNERWSWWRKYAMIAAYLPEYTLTLLAARKSKVYTNGFHIRDRLAKYGVKATGVVSSTISKMELELPLEVLPQEKLTLCYVGYLRFAKGISTLLRLIETLEKDRIDYLFNIVGNGEMYSDFEALITKYNASARVILHGHIDNRDTMNKILRKSDLFLFPSLSEGSPRVVVEAMAQGVPVFSTPVGSLPTTFTDGSEIFFFDFNDEKQLLSLIKKYTQNSTPYLEARKRAYEKIKLNYTKETFLSKIFTYET